MGEGASIGGQTTVLYETRVGAWASVADVSLVMKHETLLPGHCYRGLPAEEVHEARPAVTAAEGAARRLTDAGSWRLRAH